MGIKLMRIAILLVSFAISSCGTVKVIQSPEEAMIEKGTVFLLRASSSEESTMLDSLKKLQEMLRSERLEEARISLGKLKGFLGMSKVSQKKIITGSIEGAIIATYSKIDSRITWRKDE